MKETYRCDGCGDVWSTEKDAMLCCFESEEVTEYRCAYCGENFEYEEEADKCCIEMKLTQGYSCPECEEFFETEEQALTCCDENYKNVLVQRAAEEKGQQRMFE